MSASVRVAIIDDNERVRTSLLRLIKSAGFDAHTYSSADDFMSNGHISRTDCVVTDLRMPGLDGLALQEKLRDSDPDQAIVFLTGHANVATSVRAMKQGAVDFLRKPVDPKALLEAVVRAAELTQRSRQVRAEIVDLEGRYRTLTPRERQVFSLVTKGLLNKQIGAELGTTEKTVKVQRARVMDKMCAESFADLVRMADRLNAGRISVRGPDTGSATVNRLPPAQHAAMNLANRGRDQ